MQREDLVGIISTEWNRLTWVGYQHRHRERSVAIQRGTGRLVLLDRHAACGGSR